MSCAYKKWGFLLAVPVGFSVGEWGFLRDPTPDTSHDTPEPLGGCTN